MAQRTITPALLNRGDACAYLGIRLTKLYELTNAGELGETVVLPTPNGTPTGRGGGRLWKLAELDAFIKRNSVRTPA